ncbi:MAG: hypothetical protein KDA52_02850, partial [Planctomycetaceae bacterium]|nr:hypothetical protein [Planctomycetaceae bacterium]
MKNFVDAAYEQLIISGGDSRLLLGEDGLNPYGCGTHPNDQLAFGSCTCSTPSARGVAAAKAIIDRLRRSKSTAEMANSIRTEQRRRLKTLLRLPKEVDVAITPSGTDVELLALALAAGGHQRRIVNIVVGPTEVGSGTTLAASGMHYDHLVPSGRQVESGTPVCSQLADRVTLKTIDIRDDRGEIINEVYLDTLVTEVVTEAVASDAHVLLHLVAHSKTGMHAPSLECVDRISRNLPNDVTIVIDAAQGRVSRRGLREVLNKGHLVMFTGSKFYGGPPFSGALFVPPRWQPQNRGVSTMPSGFDDYFTAAEMPESWTEVRRHITGSQNYGSLLRWEAALAEMDAYYLVPSETRLAILRAFEESVPEIFNNAEGIQLLTVFPPIHDDTQTRLLESKTTVFGFRAHANGQDL